MTLNEYQELAMTTCLPSANNFSYMMLNLVGEVGELAGKVAKHIRKEEYAIGKIRTNELEMQFEKETIDEVEAFAEKDVALQKEAGDILWQLAGLCAVMGWELDDIAMQNLEKLHIRKEAGTINGSGDGNTIEEGRR